MSIFRTFLLLAITIVSSAFGNPKAVLFNDTSAWYHWGCTGTSTALKDGIQKLGFEIQAFPISIKNSLKEVPSFEDFNDLQKFNRFCEENRDIVEAIHDANAVVITGEGTIHGLGSGPRALLYFAHISKRFFGKHVEIINHSAYPMDDPNLYDRFSENYEAKKEKAKRDLEYAQGVYRTIYGELDFIAIREPFSQEEMRNIGISSILSFDCLPLYIRDHYQTQKQVNEKTVVVAGSAAFSETGAEKLCRYLEIIAAKGFKIQALIGAAAFPSKDDQEFVDFLKTHCKATVEVTVAASMEEWLDTINNATFLVSGRFHHSIAAFCLNTPFIALNSNTHKVHAICAVLNQPEPLLFSDPQLVDHLLLRTNAIISSPRVNNDAKVIELCQLADRNFDGLKSLAEHLSCDPPGRNTVFHLSPR